MSQDYKAGDFLVFQIESGYGLLRLLDIDEHQNGQIWHLAAYRELFLDIDMAESALENSSSLTLSHPHLALTRRAFESTQTARLQNLELNKTELEPLESWRQTGTGEVSDRSVRLLLGLR